MVVGTIVHVWVCCTVMYNKEGETAQGRRYISVKYI